MANSYTDIIVFDENTLPVGSVKRTALEAALDKIDNTVEGKALLTKMEGIYFNTSITKVIISKTITESTASFSALGKIQINWLQLQTSPLWQLDDATDSRAFSLERVLVHEMTHIALNHNGIGTAQEELQAISFANEFMAKYFGEGRRDGHDADSLGAAIPLTEPVFNPSGYAGYAYGGTIGKSMLDILEETDPILVGTRFDDTLVIGENEDRTLYAGDGNDSITINDYNPFEPGPGTVVYAGNGDDLIVSKGNNGIRGGDGEDTVSYKNVLYTDGVDVNLSLNKATIGTILDTLFDVENTIGSNQNDSLKGDDGSNKLYGEFGNDFLDGGTGSDTLYGGGNEDSILGGDGDDFLSGGHGNDTLTGGGDADIFAFEFESGACLPRSGAAAWGNVRAGRSGAAAWGNKRISHPEAKNAWGNPKCCNRQQHPANDNALINVTGRKLVEASDITIMQRLAA